MTTHPRSPLLAIGGFAGAAVAIVVIALLAGIGRAPLSGGVSSPPPSPPSSSVVAIASSAPSIEPSAAEPSRSPSPAITPSPVKPASWSKPLTITDLEGCSNVVAAIDESGAYHLAAGCSGDDEHIRYAVSRDGRSWTTTPFAPPTDRLDLDPQLAFDGQTLYLAWTRDRQDEGACGDSGLTDLGVYYRTRTLPDGAWTKPVRIGEVGDHLASLRVSHGAIHATVWQKNGGTFYERIAGTAVQRVLIPGFVAGTSLRIGDDGKPRVAYESAKGIDYATISGATVSRVTIPDTSRGFGPSLVLAPGNVAWILYHRGDNGGGCAAAEDPTDGTYVATNASGKWVSTRLTKEPYGGAFSLDPGTGAVDALASVGLALNWYHLDPGGSWKHTQIAKGPMIPTAIRINPVTGALFVVVVTDINEGTDVQVLIRQ